MVSAITSRSGSARFERRLDAVELKQPLRRGIRWNEIVRELVSREIALLP